MTSKANFFTIEVYGFYGQFNQARQDIGRIITELYPDAEALFIEHNVEAVDLAGAARQYIKIIHSNRRIAARLRRSLSSLKVCEVCLVGVFSYHDSSPAKASQASQAQKTTKSSFNLRIKKKK